MKNLFSTRLEIKKALHTVPSLDQAQREKIAELFYEQFDFGGITSGEFDLILHKLYQNKSEYGLSHTDYQGLKDLKDRLTG